MGRPSLLFLVLLAATGSWFLFNEVPTNRIDSSSSSRKFSGRQKSPLDNGSALMDGPRRPDTIRIASFNLDNFDRHKSQSPDALQSLAAIIRSFDVVAIQEVRCLEQHVVPRLVDAINGTSQDFEFVVGPHVGRFELQEQFAFIYNRKRVELNRSGVYTIQDPDDLIHSEPLVGSFRVRGINPADAFTFTLVNIRTDGTMGETERENRLLRGIFENVRNDQRGEDDVILLGDFQVPTAQLKQAAQLPSAVFVIAETPTDPAQTAQRDNIIFDSMATVEFTGRSGVVDFLRQMNLTLEQAQRVSKHLPVWAEFTAFEGALHRRMARSTADSNDAIQ